MSEKTPKQTNRSFFDWLGFRMDMDWNVAKPLGRAFGSILLVAIPLLFFGAIIAAAFVLWGTIRDIGSGASSGPNLGAGAMVAALLGAPFIIWGTYIRQRAVEFQKEGLFTDRINKAVEMLGAEKTTITPGKNGSEERTVPNIEVRIGGLFALERIAQDSVAYDKGRDHVRVMEILCAYIRENAPASQAKKSLRRLWLEKEPILEEKRSQLEKEFCESHGVLHLDYSTSLDASKKWVATLLPPREDIAIALRVIGSRGEAQVRMERNSYSESGSSYKDPLDDFFMTREEQQALEKSPDSLRRFRTKFISYFLSPNFSFKIDLRNTNLQGADFKSLNFDGADFRYSELAGAIFDETRAIGADFSFAKMQHCQFWQMVCVGADFSSANIEGSSWYWSNLSGAIFRDTVADGISVIESAADGIEFVPNSFLNAVFQNTSLFGSNLSPASAIFSCSKPEVIGSLENADLELAAFKSVDLSKSNITSEQIERAFADRSVILPKQLLPPSHWPSWVIPDFLAQSDLWRSDPNSYTPPRNPSV